MKKVLLASLIVAGGLATISTFAYKGMPAVENPNPVDPARHEAVQEAIENNDYTTWKELMEGKRILNKITTEEQFQSFIDMREAHRNGDLTTYNKLREELDLGQRNGGGNQGGQKRGQGKKSQ